MVSPVAAQAGHGDGNIADFFLNDKKIDIRGEAHVLISMCCLLMLIWVYFGLDFVHTRLAEEASTLSH